MTGLHGLPAPVHRHARVPSPQPAARRPALAFSLIELLVSTAIAMILATLAVTVYLQVRRLMVRDEALMTMHDQAQAVYTALYRDFQASMPTCGMSLTSGAGSLDLIMMRGKEDSYDYDPNESWAKTDLVWDEWHFTGSVISHALSSPARTFVPNPPGVSFSSQAFSNGNSFLNLPQPRRWLDPAAPQATLDDNIYFPSAPGTAGGASLASSADIGDFTDLQRNLLPVVDDVSDLSMQLVFHDGSVQTFGPGGAAATAVFPGVWLDGRLANRLSDPPIYASSPIVHRPELVRISFTLSAPVQGVRQTYSFSFPLPALSTNP